MSDKSKNQIEDWLKKLERESWQLELLVSAFTIFLLIGANTAFGDFLNGLNYKYNLSGTGPAIIGLFLMVINNSIKALTICLVIHLMLRGFWIGTIGLRSVQSSIDFSKLNYNSFFTEKLKKKVISLDRMVVMLDEICSVIFAFSFLIISILISFGTYLAFIGVLGLGFSYLVGITSGFGTIIVLILGGLIMVLIFLMGIIYMIDYFSLGFFKKIKWFAKVYYPFYRLFSLVTLSGLSRSIYYYLISKFSKKRIRILYAVIGGVALFMIIFEYDNHQYYPKSSDFFVNSNVYEDQRDSDEYIAQISIPSDFIEKPFFPLFLRYNPSDNGMIKTHCPDFVPVIDDGINSKFQFDVDGNNFHLRNRDYSIEDFELLLDCHSSIYEVSINDSIYSELTYRFFTHPSKEQKGLLTVIPTDAFLNGENELSVRKVSLDSAGVRSSQGFVTIPFWYSAK